MKMFRIPSQIGAACSLLALALLLNRCGESTNADVPMLAPTQPNESSELAHAMRVLDAELVELKSTFGQNESAWDGATISSLDLNQLEPTDSSMLVEGYTAYAIAFSKQVEAFNLAPNAETYDGVVTGCLNCHQRACPGPLERISKRRIE